MSKEAPMGQSLFGQGTLPPSVELFVVGLCMAASVYPTDDEDEGDFGLWRRAWDALCPAWECQARSLGWRSVGMNWEYHDTDAWLPIGAMLGMDDPCCGEPGEPGEATPP